MNSGNERNTDSSQQKTDHKKPHLILAAGILVAIILGFIYVVSIGDIIQPSEQDFSRDLQEAIQARSSGDRETSIDLFRGLLSQNVEAEQKANIEMFLAEDVIHANPDEGMSLFKSVAGNESYPLYERANAVSSMADIYMLGNQDPNYALQYIFVGDPYSTFLEEEEGGSIRIVNSIQRLYEYSLEFGSLPTSEYRIGQIVGRRLFNPENSKQDSAKIVKLLKEHVEKGDDVLGRYLIWAEANRPSSVGYVYWLRGHVYGLLGVETRAEEYLEEAEQSFQNSLAQFDRLQETEYVALQRIWAEYHYALFLMNAYGSDREDDIRPLLKDIADRYVPREVRSPGFHKYIRKLGIIGPAVVNSYYFFGHQIENTKKLAIFESDFAQMLRSLGWTVQ